MSTQDSTDCTTVVEKMRSLTDAELGEVSGGETVSEFFSAAVAPFFNRGGCRPCVNCMEITQYGERGHPRPL